MKKVIVLFFLFLSVAALTHAAVGDPTGFFWSGTLDGNNNHLTDNLFEFKETSVAGLYVLDADDYSGKTKESGKFTMSNSENSKDAFLIKIKGAYVGLSASIASITENNNDTVFNTVQKNEIYQLLKDTTPNANIRYGITGDETCERIFLYYPSYGGINPILYFTDQSVAYVETSVKNEYGDKAQKPATEPSDFVIVTGNDQFSNNYRFQKTAYTDVYELVGQFNIKDQFKITQWVDSDGDGVGDKTETDVAWEKMNLGRDVKGSKGKNETVDRKFKNNTIRDIVVGSPFALVSGNDPMWINDGEDSNNTPETVTFKKAIFVYHPVFPSLYLTNDPTYEWVENQLSAAHLCADEITDTWGNTFGLANSFKTTKFPQVYEYTGLITFNNPGVRNDADDGWKTWPSRLQVKVGEESDPDHVILGFDNKKIIADEDKISLNEPFSLQEFNQTAGNNYFGNDVHTDLPFTFHRAFLYYDGYGDENPVLYLVGDPNFEARPLDVLYEGFPVNLFMRGEDFDENNNNSPARHKYQFYTTDQPNVYELNHANDNKNTHLMQGNTYTFSSTFRVGGKELDEPWRVELGDVLNPTTRIELSTEEGGVKPYVLSNNSGNSANYTQVTPAIDKGEPDFEVYRTVLNYDGGAMPILTIYGYQNTEVVKTDVIVFGRSKYGLKVWDNDAYSTASWDNSGGLTDCITKNAADETFMQDYIYMVTDDSDEAQKMVMFRGPLNILKETDAEYAKYSALKDAYPAEHGGNVYVIDFTDGYENGIYVKVPAETDNGNVSIPQHMASGVRFVVYNYNYVPQSATDVLNMRKYLKYGHAFRLNENLRPLRGMIGADGNWTENGGGVKWDENGVYSTTNKENWNNGSESIETSMANQKIGDSRLLSEYNFYLKRIILEVVNDGKNQNEQLYIRFEGRYDLGGKMEAKRTYYYNSPEGENNGVVEDANIVVGTKYEGRDRAFNRYYANTDRNLLGGISNNELNALTDRGIYPNLTDGYKATTTYTLKDKDNKTVIEGESEYRFEIPMTTSAKATTDSRVVVDGTIDSNNPQYGTATPYLSTVGAYEETFYFDPTMATAPTQYEVSTVYDFDNDKIAEDAYVGTGSFDTSDNFEFSPKLKAEAKERGVGEYEGWYNSTLTITPGELYDDENNKLPVTRYTITQMDTELKKMVVAKSYDNAIGSNVTDWSQECVQHDGENKDTRTQLDNVWMTYTDNDEVVSQKLSNEDDAYVDIQYDLTQYYTFAYPKGFYTEAQISGASILGATQEGRAANNVEYRLEQLTKAADPVTVRFAVKDTKIGTTGIDSVGYEDVAVGVESGAIVISGSEAEAAVYTTSGQTIYVGAERRIEVPSGVYIVKVAGQVSKVAVI